MVNYKCQNCKWFDHQHISLADPDISDNYGYCRKHKPMVFNIKNKFYGGWPLVDINDLCGEYREDIDGMSNTG